MVEAVPALSSCWMLMKKIIEAVDQVDQTQDDGKALTVRLLWTSGAIEMHFVAVHSSPSRHIFGNAQSRTRRSGYVGLFEGDSLI